MQFVILFSVKLLDQILRTKYLLFVKNDNKEAATVIVGIQQMIFILITIFIVQNYSIPNVIALISSTMIGTYITMHKSK